MVALHGTPTARGKINCPLGAKSGSGAIEKQRLYLVQATAPCFCLPCKISSYATISPPDSGIYLSAYEKFYFTTQGDDDGFLVQGVDTTTTFDFRFWKMV